MKAVPTEESGQTASLESDLAGLQLQLMQTNSAENRAQLLDKLVEYERRLELAWTKEDSPSDGFPVHRALLTGLVTLLESAPGLAVAVKHYCPLSRAHLPRTHLLSALHPPYELSGIRPANSGHVEALRTAAGSICHPVR